MRRNGFDDVQGGWDLHKGSVERSTSTMGKPFTSNIGHAEPDTTVNHYHEGE